MGFEFWLAYCATIFVVSIIPGPSMLLALTHGMRYGIRASLMTAGGNTAASALQACIAITGLGAVLLASEWVFQLIKWAGAAYLVYIGIMIWRHPIAAPGTDEENVPLRKSGWRQFKQAFIIAMGNPKAVLFFTALFPQFIQDAGSGPVQYLQMVLSLSVIAFLCMMIYAVGGRKLMNVIENSRIRRRISKGISGLFISGGIGLALSGR